MEKPKIVITTDQGTIERIYSNQPVDIAYRATGRKVEDPGQEHTGIYTTKVTVVSNQEIEELMTVNQ